MLRDLFGNDHPEPKGAIVAPVALNLFDAAAEQKAFKSGRPKSQERTELMAGAGFRCLKDHRLEKIRGGGYRCPECD